VGDGTSLLAVSWLAIRLAPATNASIWGAAAVATYTLPGVLGTVLFSRILSGRSRPNWTRGTPFSGRWSCVAVSGLRSQSSIAW
jgi:hypothetical protein